MRNTNKAWQNFGQIDPYLTVLAHPRFREAAKEGRARREFFTSGEEHVERFLAAVREDLDPKFTHGRNFLHSFIAFQHIPARRSANILREMPRRLSENGVGALHFNIRNLRPRLETLVARTPRDLPLGQRPNQPCKRRFFQTSIHRDAQLQRQPVAPPSARARVSSGSLPVLRLWAVQRQSFTL
jgi:hypothetical protein